MKRRNFVQIAAGASLGAGFGPLFAAKGEDGDRLHPFYTNPQIRRFGDCRDWFFEKRFGMFVHWGLYAIPGWHEQHQWRGRIERDEYVRLAQKWNPFRGPRKPASLSALKAGDIAAMRIFTQTVT